MFAGPGRLPAVHRLDLQEVGTFGLAVKNSLRVDETQLGVDAKILVVPISILKQRVGDLEERQYLWCQHLFRKRVYLSAGFHLAIEA